MQRFFPFVTITAAAGGILSYAFFFKKICKDTVISLKNQLDYIKDNINEIETESEQYAYLIHGDYIRDQDVRNVIPEGFYTLPEINQTDPAWNDCGDPTWWKVEPRKTVDITNKQTFQRLLRYEYCQEVDVQPIFVEDDIPLIDTSCERESQIMDLKNQLYDALENHHRTELYN